MIIKKIEIIVKLDPGILDILVVCTRLLIWGVIIIVGHLLVGWVAQSICRWEVVTRYINMSISGKFLCLITRSKVEKVFIIMLEEVCV